LFLLFHHIGGIVDHHCLKFHFIKLIHLIWRIAVSVGTIELVKKFHMLFISNNVVTQTVVVCNQNLNILMFSVALYFNVCRCFYYCLVYHYLWLGTRVLIVGLLYQMELSDCVLSSPPPPFFLSQCIFDLHVLITPPISL
jgi:hypothetical protein